MQRILLAQWPLSAPSFHFCVCFFLPYAAAAARFYLLSLWLASCVDQPIVLYIADHVNVQKISYFFCLFLSDKLKGHKHHH